MFSRNSFKYAIGIGDRTNKMASQVNFQTKQETAVPFAAEKIFIFKIQRRQIIHTICHNKVPKILNDCNFSRISKHFIVKARAYCKITSLQKRLLTHSSFLFEETNTFPPVYVCLPRQHWKLFAGTDCKFLVGLDHHDGQTAWPNLKLASQKCFSRTQDEMLVRFEN